MAEIIKFKKKPENVPDNLVTLKPWEFRRANWESKYFVQMLRSHWNRLERQWKEGAQIPSHFALKGGMAHTIQGIYAYRNNREKMKEVYYLAGLIDCMINQVNPILRTDSIGDIYRKVTTLKMILEINWYGHIDQVLFPIDNRFYNHLEYRDRLSRAGTMEELYHQIRDGIEEMFNILSSKYIFFTPSRGTQ